MRAVVLYESMYGNTHMVADAIADGLRSGYDDVAVLPVGDATTQSLANTDLLVVGGPTHVHGMSRPSTRKAAADALEKNDDLTLDPNAEGPGLRDWFETVDKLPRRAAAFDTRIDASPILTGRASKGIAKRLHAHGCRLVGDPVSFLVTKENHLVEHEIDQARTWGKELAART
jgi:menaquinone-dependent protoporphyrinogen IX oxidase